MMIRATIVALAMATAQAHFVSNVQADNHQICAANDTAHTCDVDSEPFVYSYHVHVLFDADNYMDLAQEIHSNFAEAFDAPDCDDGSGTFYEGSLVGPSVCALDFGKGNPPDQSHLFPTCMFSFFVPKDDYENTTAIYDWWAEPANNNFSVVVHPQTGCQIYDHMNWSVWINNEDAGLELNPANLPCQCETYQPDCGIGAGHAPNCYPFSHYSDDDEWPHVSSGSSSSMQPVSKPTESESESGSDAGDDDVSGDNHQKCSDEDEATRACDLDSEPFVYSYHVHVLFDSDAGELELAQSTLKDFIAAFDADDSCDGVDEGTFYEGSLVGDTVCALDFDTKNPPDDSHLFPLAMFSLFVPKADYEETTAIRDWWADEENNKFSVVIHPQTGCQIYDHMNWSEWINQGDLELNPSGLPCQCETYQPDVGIHGGHYPNCYPFSTYSDDDEFPHSS